MSRIPADENEDLTYKFHWVELSIPVIEKETEEHKSQRLDGVRKVLVEQLADNMLKAGAIDINMDTVTNKAGGSEYRFNAATVLTNPCSVHYGDNLALKRLQNYGKNYPFSSMEERDLFDEVLTSMQHEPVTRH